jgi:SAM-dependent methyltransferase
MGLLRPLAIYYETRMKLAKLRIHLLPRRGWRVLDVGSGDGPTPAADVLCDRFVGDDAERTAPLKLDRPFVSGDAQDLPFVDGAFDFVYCSHVLEHTTDPTRAISELQRVARAGYIEVPSEYLEKAAKSTAAHLWFVRQENRALVFSPKPAGTLEPLINLAFDERLMEKMTYTAFHWRGYDLFIIRFVWRGTIPHRVEGSVQFVEVFSKAGVLLPGPGRPAEGTQIMRASDAHHVKIKTFYQTPDTALPRRRQNLITSTFACPVCKKLCNVRRSSSGLSASTAEWYPWIGGIPCLIRQRVT